MATKRKPVAKKTTKKTRKKATLKPSHRTFAEGVLRHGNGTQAAADAGYQGNRDTLAVTASRLLRNAKVSAYLEERIAGLKASTDEVHNLLAQHLRGDVALFEECFKSNGDIDLVRAHEIGVSRLVKKLKRRRRPVIDSKGKVLGHEFIVELEIYDAQGAASKLADLLGMKQQPQANDADREHDREMIARVNAEVKSLVQSGWSEAEARGIVLEAEPLAAQWLQ